jgi:hypothetical protein
MYRSTFFLTSAVAGGDRPASHRCRFTPPPERATGTHWIGGLVDLRAGLDDVEKRYKRLKIGGGQAYDRSSV